MLRCVMPRFRQDLDITSRAHVLDALQQLKLSAHKDRQVLCANHFC